MSKAMILAPSGATLTDDERSFFRAADPWGFILFARNVESPDQIRRLTGGLRDSVGRDAPILIDQEGGRVQRMRAPSWREWMPPLDETAFANPRSFYLRYALIAHELRSVGIDVNCAPCCDIAFAETHPFLRNRCLGESADQVVPNARAAIEGHVLGGCLPVVKHVPGHGRASLDSHLELPRVTTPIDELLLSDFKVFSAVSDAILAMSAHVIYTALDPDLPATLSRSVVEFIRTKIGMQGLLISDDLSMGALSGSLGERVTLSLRAGCDVVLHCSGEMDEMTEVAGAVHAFSGQSLARANRALAHRPTVSDIDVTALLDEYHATIGKT